MRLLQINTDGTFGLTKDFIGDDEVPAYAILSHTWRAGQEVTFDDFENGTGEAKAGYRKIKFCAEQAEQDGLSYFWVDTCCIRKSNAVELQDAINSMFRWYRDAAKCYVFLADVFISKRRLSGESGSRTWEPAFRESRWFTRGWTLQELLAPRNVKFYSQEGKPLGDRHELKHLINEITKIPILALEGTSLERFDIRVQMSWSEKRNTTRKEDKAYSLLGIFGVYIPLIYGEGQDPAFQRLRKCIQDSLDDLALLGPSNSDAIETANSRSIAPPKPSDIELGMSLMMYISQVTHQIQTA